MYDAVKQIVEDCKRVGVYLVPVGEVEQWQPTDIEGAPSQKRKAEWANWAAAAIRQNAQPWAALLHFMKSLEAFEKLEAQRIANE